MSAPRPAAAPNAARRGAAARAAVRRAPFGRAATGIAIAAALLVAAGGVYFAFASSRPLPVDRWWAEATATSAGTPAHAVGVFLSEAGSTIGVIGFAAIAAAFLLVLGQRRAVGFLATSITLGLVAMELTKLLVLRPRPPSPLVAVFQSSYPSGHATGAAALAISLALIAANFPGLHERAMRWVWIAATAWVLLMMWSRTALGAHWISDTVAGAILGTGAAFGAYRWWLAYGPLLRPGGR